MRTQGLVADATPGALAGITFMVVASFNMSLNNAILKWLSVGYPSGQILFMRGIFIFIPIAFFVWRTGKLSSLRIHSFRDHAIRAGFTVCSAFLFVAAVRNLPLADTIAITFTGPLFVTMFAAPLLGESVGFRRWSAVVVGFLGVLVITRPSGEAAWLLMLLPLGAAFAAAMRDLVTRRMTSVESSNAILVTTTTAVMLAGLLTAPFGWRAPTLPDLGLVALCGMISGVGHFCMIEAFRYAEAALVSPFKYSSILWAAALGYMFWGEVPDLWFAVGALIVVASGLYILHREIVRRRGG